MSSTRTSPTTTNLPPRLSPFVWTDVAIAAFATFWIATHAPRHATYFIGLPVALIGICLWITARIQLGRSFSVTAQAKALVTSGLYSKFRHPVYVFGHVTMLGIAFMVNVWWFYALWPFGILFQYARTRREEAVLAQAFGEEYQRYKSQTWF